jgi:hypothetical protein
VQPAWLRLSSGPAHPARHEGAEGPSARRRTVASCTQCPGPGQMRQCAVDPVRNRRHAIAYGSVLHAKSSPALGPRLLRAIRRPRRRYRVHSSLHASIARNKWPLYAGSGTLPGLVRSKSQEFSPCSRFLPYVFARAGLPPRVWRARLSVQSRTPGASRCLVIFGCSVGPERWPHHYKPQPLI